MAVPRLRKWSITVLKDKSLSDSAQVPSSGDSIVLYKRGGVVRTATTVTNAATNVSIDVRDSSPFQVGDVLKVWSITGLTLSTGSFTVDQITNGYVIRVDSDSNGTVTLGLSDRLVIVNPSGRLCFMYSEPSGVVYAGASLTTDSNGYAQAYVRDRFVDAVVSRSGNVVAFLESEISGEDEPWNSVYNTNGNYTEAAIQEAIDNCTEDMQEVIIPAGTWTISNPITLSRPIRLRGAGIGATNLYTSGVNTDCLMINESYSQISDLSIIGPGGSGTGRGIVVGSTSTAVVGVTIYNVKVNDMPSYGIQYGGGTVSEGGFGYVISGAFTNVEINDSRSGAGMYVGSASFTTTFTACRFYQGNSTAVYAYRERGATDMVHHGTEMICADNTFAMWCDDDGSGIGNSTPGPCTYINLDVETRAGGGTTAPMIKVTDGKNVTFIGCYLLNGAGGGFLFEDCIAPTIINCHTKGLDGTPADIKFTGCTAPLMLGNYSYSTDPTEAPELVSWEQDASTTGAMALQNGVVTVPNYTTANLPAGTAQMITTGSLAFDTTTNTLKVLRNDGTTWANVP